MPLSAARQRHILKTETVCTVNQKSESRQKGACINAEKGVRIEITGRDLSESWYGNTSVEALSDRLLYILKE